MYVVGTMRLFAISDLHTDMATNLKWIDDLDNDRWKQDAIIVAGDVAERTEIVIATLKLLKSKFAEVFFVAGNHDVWGAKDSLEKLDQLYDKLRAFGVKCEPALLDGRVWVVPLDSWHYFDIDNEAHDFDLARLRLWRDFEKCTWLPSAVGSHSTANTAGFDPIAKLKEAQAVARLMMERNEATLERVFALQAVRHLPVVTFSHFVPRFDLNPKFTRFKELTAVSVCAGLDAQLRSIRSSVHIFGHTHHRTDRTVEGVRYIQFPLGYPTEGVYCPRFPDISTNEVII